MDLKGRDGSENILGLGYPPVCKEPNTCCGQPGLAMGLSPCSSGEHPDKTFHGLFVMQQTRRKKGFDPEQTKKEGSTQAA